MKATFYKLSGFGYVQTEIIDYVKKTTKSELLKIADLRHPVLTKKEFYEVLSTDINGNKRYEFSLLSHTHYIVVETKY
jgi:hypothetical protein